MRLGAFILENMELILAEWEDNARRDWIGMMPDVETLRDHAALMLRAVVEDMTTFQTPAERKTKSEGSDDCGDSPIKSAAVSHALARINDGFDIERIIAEFRALRAAVDLIWWESLPDPHREQIDDMGRFNEAIDQLVAISVSAYTARVEQNRRVFLGILSHDLRQPLASLCMTTGVMKENPDLPREKRQELLVKMERSCGAMTALLSDLLDFTTTQLGSAMPVFPVPTDLETLCGEIISEVRDAAPRPTITLEAKGDLTGEWDPARLRQLVSNLLVNAAFHGSPDTPIITTLDGCEGEVVLSVHNTGGNIPEDALANLFNPMMSIASKDGTRLAGSMGLGLYICRQIANAHGGVICADSSAEKGTTFSVTLPRHHSPQHHPET